MTMKTGLTAFIAAITIACIPLTAGAVPFVSNNAALVAAFQAGATIQTFEGIPGVTAFNNQTARNSCSGCGSLEKSDCRSHFFQ